MHHHSFHVYSNWFDLLNLQSTSWLFNVNLVVELTVVLCFRRIDLKYIWNIHVKLKIKNVNFLVFKDGLNIYLLLCKKSDGIKMFQSCRITKSPTHNLSSNNLQEEHALLTGLHSSVMVVYEKFCFRFSHHFLSKARRKIYSHRQPL